MMSGNVFVLHVGSATVVCRCKALLSCGGCVNLVFTGRINQKTANKTPQSNSGQFVAGARMGNEDII